jgi:NADP-dependent 3-hydroxy acid dehydrogenase YdfG
VKAEFDTFDLLFVNAGFSIRVPMESITEAVYDEMFNLNAKRTQPTQVWPRSELRR